MQAGGSQPTGRHRPSFMSGRATQEPKEKRKAVPAARWGCAEYGRSRSMNLVKPCHAQFAEPGLPDSKHKLSVFVIPRNAFAYRACCDMDI